MSIQAELVGLLDAVSPVMSEGAGTLIGMVPYPSMFETGFGEMHPQCLTELTEQRMKTLGLP